MGFTQRVSVPGGPILATYDAPALFGGLAYTARLDLGISCSSADIHQINLTALAGAGGSLIQDAGNNAAGSFSSHTIAYTNPNAAGSCLVLDVAYEAGSFLYNSISVTDSQGNTWTRVAFGNPSFQDAHLQTWICASCAAGANTVTISISGTNFSTIAAAIHEYGSAGASLAATYATGPLFGTGTPVSAAVTPSSGALLHLAVQGLQCTGSAISLTGPGVLPSSAWLVINEPGDGFTDRTSYMFKGDASQTSFTQQLRQRGQASIVLRIDDTDSYAPTRLSPIYLFDQNSEGFNTVFAGLIQDIENQYFGNDGYRFVTLTAVSLESVFDTIYAQPTQYVGQTCGYIVTDLFGKFEAGSPVSLGTISAGVTLDLFNAQKGASLSELFNQLAATCGFTWYVDPVSQTLFFGDPAAIAAPFTLASSDINWESNVNWQTRGADFRNRQGVRGSFDAFGHSKEFFTGSGQLSVTLSRPVKQVTNAWATLSTCNAVTGTFAGQPAAGDTVTIGPASGVRQASHAYSLGGVIIVNGFVQKVTTAGTTAAGAGPTFSTITGATTVDGTAIWTCQGPSGLSTGTETYTFVTALDNTVFGEVLIGASSAATCQNLADAINRYVGGATGRAPGTNYSLPTWEGTECNAIYTPGSSFTLQQKSAGTGWVSQVSAVSVNFAWSGAFTSGGTSPQGSLGPNEGATIELQVYAAGTSTAAPGLSYTEGSAVLTLATPLNVGSNLNVEYTREDGDTIEVEDSDSVAALAAITHGTGRYQAFTDQSSKGLISSSKLDLLQYAQSLLATFKVAPEHFKFQTFRAGLSAGQTLPVSLLYPLGVSSLLDGNWLIETVEAQLVPVDQSDAEPWLHGGTEQGHFEYAITALNVTQIGSDLDFWNSLGSGGSGGTGAAGGLVATSGGGTSTAGLSPTTGGVNAQTASYAAVAGDSGKLLSMSNAGAFTLTLPNPAPSTQWNVFVENTGAGTLTISRNSLTIDGAAANVTLTTGQGMYISTDGTNYFTERGRGGNVTAAATLTADLPVFGDGTTAVKVGTKTGNTNAVVTQSGAATSGAPVFYDASGNAVAGTKSGNTTEAATVSGALTSGHGVVSDASGNLIDSGATPGTGTVTHTGALTLDLPVFGNGTADVKAGTKTGNTDAVVTASGAATSGAPLLYDANGNAISGTKSGNTTELVSATGASTSGYPLLYDANGNAVARQPRGNTTVVQLADSTTNPTTGDLAKFDANGNIADAGVLASAILANPMTTLGDLIAGGVAGLATRLPIGSNGKVLTADSAKTLGMDWEALAAAFITSLTTTGTSGAATVSGGVLNIPQYSGGGGGGSSQLYGIGQFGSNSLGSLVATYANNASITWGPLTPTLTDTVHTFTPVAGHVYRIVFYFVGGAGGANLCLMVAGTSGAGSKGYFFGNAGPYFVNGAAFTSIAATGAPIGAAVMNEGVAQIAEVYIWVIAASRNKIWGRGFGVEWWANIDTNAAFTTNNLQLGFGAAASPSAVTNIYAYDLGAVLTS